jgi:hypothetical protein
MEAGSGTVWQRDLELWLERFLQGLGNKMRRRMCPPTLPTDWPG